MSALMVADTTEALVLQRDDEWSAERVLAPNQRVAVSALIALTVLGLLVAPTTTAVAIVGAGMGVFVGAVGVRVVYCWLGWRHGGPVNPDLATLRGSAARRPSITVLVALYREENVVPELARALADLEYEESLLEVIFLVECDDPETVAACHAATRCRSRWRVAVVPDGRPRTKPRALNHGLGIATGELLTIFDAEDRPEQDQLLKAAAAFEALPATTVALQARLDFYNVDQNLLTKLFACDYATHFGPYLDGIARRGHPVPLGGTSTYFRTAALLRLGGWDPWNVTEDCQLGLRIAAAGNGTLTLASTTWEEAVPMPRAWVRQRSRWMKGFAQTGLVLLRSPVSRVRETGVGSYASSVLTVAAVPVVFLLQPVFWLLLLLYAAFAGVGADPNPVKTLFPLPVELVGGVCLLAGNVAMIEVALAALYQQRRYPLLRIALLMPGYWALASVAAWLAAWQLVWQPHYWEKTTHGCSGGYAREEAEAVDDTAASERGHGLPEPQVVRTADAP